MTTTEKNCQHQTSGLDEAEFRGSDRRSRIITVTILWALGILVFLLPSGATLGFVNFVGFITLLLGSHYTYIAFLEERWLAMVLVLLILGWCTYQCFIYKAPRSRIKPQSEVGCSDHQNKGRINSLKESTQREQSFAWPERSKLF